MRKVKLYFNTMRYLKFKQVQSRIVKRIIPQSYTEAREIPDCRSISLLIPELDLCEDYRRRFDCTEMLSGRICLLNNYYLLSFSDDNKSKMSPLCWYNLQYFEYGIALGAEYRASHNSELYKVFKKSFYDYVSQNIPFEPYVVSLQIPNLLIASELFDDIIDIELRNDINKILYNSYLFLQKNLETHLLGNHFLENLKALVIASFCFREDSKCEKFLNMLKKELHEEILPDGMHFELSPMYHKIVLEDMLRVACLKRYEGFPQCTWIEDTIENLLNAMCFLENGFDRTPLFNDCGDNVAKSSTQYIKAAQKLLSVKPKRISCLPDAGYYRLDNDFSALLVDIGRIGPDYIPGHGQCDCLSFELAIGGKAVIVNSGTLLYQGELRPFFRSTKAHNTVVMDGHEQSECWGEHRVARRISSVRAEQSPGMITGEYKNYCGQVHRRVFHQDANIITVYDEIINAASAKSYLHFSNDFTVTDNLSVISKDGSEVCRIEPINCDAAVYSDGQYAPEFGKVFSSSYIEFSFNSDSAVNHGYKIIIIEGE